MSVLEIILYVALGTGVITYLTIGIIKIVKKNKECKKNNICETCKYFKKCKKAVLSTENED